MQKYFEFLNKNIWIILLISLVTILLQDLTGAVVLSDPFHYGEYFASSVIFFTKQSVDFTPLTIHGALDFIPALIARNIWGSDSYFLPTYFLYKIINVTSSLILLAIAFDLIKDNKNRWIVLLSLSIAAPLLVGYRDIVLLTTLYLFLKINKNSLETSTDIIILVIFGVITALGLFWSFDRGISGAASFGVATLLLTIRNKKYVFSLLTFFFSIFIISFYFQTFSLVNYIENIKVLMETSNQWSYGWKRGPVIASLFAAGFNLTVIICVMMACHINKSLLSRFPELILFIFLSIFMLKIGTNRADWGHVYSSLWIPILMLFYFKNENIFEKSIAVRLIFLLLLIAFAVSIKDMVYLPVLLVGLMAYLVFSHVETFCSNDVNVTYIAFVIILLFFIFPTSIKFANDKYKWLAHIYSPPTNNSASTEGVRWVSDRLIRSKSTCVFDLSNNGVINGLTTLPSCSRFTYPVYAGLVHETELINAVRETSPPAIVYSSTYWSYSIDGKSMRDRFPQLDIFLLQQYPNMECANGYCIRYLKD